MVILVFVSILETSKFGNLVSTFSDRLNLPMVLLLYCYCTATVPLLYCCTFVEQLLLHCCYTASCLLFFTFLKTKGQQTPRTLLKSISTSSAQPPHL